MNNIDDKNTTKPTPLPPKLTCIVCHEKLSIDMDKHICKYRKNICEISVVQTELIETINL